MNHSCQVVILHPALHLLLAAVISQTLSSELLDDREIESLTVL